MLPKMTPFEEGLWGYVKDRKTPVTIKQISKYFIVSDTKASNALNALVKYGMMDLFYVGTTKHYRTK